MKHLSIATLAAALLVSATAFAADNHKSGGAPHGGGAPHASGAPHGGGGGFHGGGHTASFSHASSHSFNRGVSEHSSSHNTASYRTHETVEHRTTTATHTHRSGGAYGGMTHEATGGPAHNAHDSRGYGVRPANANDRPRNFNRASYQRNATASQRFHYGSYNAPGGYHYQRWAFGAYLPSIYWARDYWLTSWWMFDLAIPPYGYEWVRYGDDALLVNVYNGQILQVDYGVFY